MVENYFAVKHVRNTEEYLYGSSDFNIILPELDKCLYHVDQLPIKM